MVDPATASTAKYAYDAFISYRHSEKESAIACELQRALQNFAKPFWKLRAVRIYRDETNLSARPDLWGTITQALDESRFFLLMASPEASASKWVRREVKHWLATRGTAGLIIVQAGGILEWDDQMKRFNVLHTNALPEPLLDRLETEPLYIDLTWVSRPDLHLVMSNPRFADAVATIAAELHGKDKDEIAGEDLRQHQRTRLLSYGAVSIITLLAFAALGFAVYSQFQKHEAIAQRDASTSRSLAAQAETLVDQRGTLLITAGLLAVEGMKIAPSLEADRALRKVLALLPKRIADMNCAVDGDVQKGAFSPDGAHMATVAGDKIVRVWESSTGQLLDQFGAEPVDKLIFSPTLSHLVVLGGGRATIRDFASGRAMSLLREDLRDVAYSPDGNFLASVGTDKTTRLWDGSDFSQIAEMANSQEMLFLAVSPQADELIAWNTDIAEVFRSPGRPDQTIEFGFQGLTNFQYSPNGTYLALVAPQSYSVKLLDVASRQSLLFEKRHWNLAFSGNGTTLALASPEWDANAYDLSSCNQAGIQWAPETGGILRPKPVYGRGSCSRFDSVHHDNSITKINLSHDGKYMGTTSSDHTARVWEAYRGREVLRLLEEAEGTVNEMAFSTDGHHLTGWGSKTCRTWESSGHRQVVALSHPDAIDDLAFSGNGQSAATVGQDGWGQDGTVRIWTVPEWKEVRRISVKRPATKFSIALNTDASKLLVNQSDIFDLQKGEKITELPVAESARLWATSANWQFAVGVTTDNSMVVFKGDTKVATHKALGGEIEAVAIAPDGCCVAAAVAGEGVRIWRWAEHEESSPIALDKTIWVLSFDFSGTQVAAIVGDEHSHVAVLDLKTARAKSMLVHEGEVSSAAFDPAGKFVVTAADDRTVRVWDLTTSRPVAEIVHDADARAAKFTPNSKYVLSTGGRSDRTARLWLWRPTDLISETCSRLRRKTLTEEEWRQYVGTAEHRPTCPPDKEG